MSTYLMNPHSGAVDTLENWQCIFENCTPEEWGGENFEDAHLLEVVYEDGDWVIVPLWASEHIHG